MDVVSTDYRIKTVLSRLEMIIDNENDRIGRDSGFDLKVSNAHKSRCLYELTTLFRGPDVVCLYPHRHVGDRASGARLLQLFRHPGPRAPARRADRQRPRHCAGR